MKEKLLSCILYVVLPLALGVLLYLWIKPDAWCSQMIYRLLHIPKQSAFDDNSVPIIGTFIKHQLCDVLFAFSLTFALLLLLVNHSRGIALGCAIALSFEVMLEVAQLSVFPGNFDIYDIIAESVVTIAIYIAIKIIQAKRRRKIK